MTVAIGIFFFSLTGILGLFFLKDWEVRRSRVLFPGVRDTLDHWASRINNLVAVVQKEIGNLPPELLHLSRILVHELALAAAALLRFLEKRAHQLADLVSHKHAFQRRAPRSEFLKKVSEGKNEGVEQRE